MFEYHTFPLTHIHIRRHLATLAHHGRAALILRLLIAQRIGNLATTLEKRHRTPRLTLPLQIALTSASIIAISVDNVIRLQREMIDKKGQTTI
jgi:hypothetical protein